MGLTTGLAEINVTDAEQRLTFPMVVMYPTEVPETPTKLGPYYINAAREAPVHAGTFPVVVISHGTGSSNQVFRNLAAFLAKNRFIVGMPEHPFNNRNNNERADTTENLTDRPRHITCAIDCIFSHEIFAAHVKKDGVGVIGHSLGAYTALALAGGIPHTKHQINHDPTTKITRSQEIEVKTDGRVKTLVLLAPAAGWYLSEGALSKVETPILILSGEKDLITPLFHAEIVKDGVGESTNVRHKIIPRAGHFSFLSPFPKETTPPNFPPAQDPEGFNREKYHEEMNPEILGWFRETL